MALQSGRPGTERTRCRSLLLLTIGLVAALSSSSAAAKAGSIGNICALSLRSGSQTCYAATQATVAERRAGFQVVSPLAVVVAATHLRLAQVSVVATATRRVMGIDYVFGRLGPGQDPILLPSTVAETPRYVLVQERKGAIVPAHVRLARLRPGGPWQFTALLPARHLSLLVTSNVSEAAVHLIGVTLVRHSRHWVRVAR